MKNLINFFLKAGQIKRMKQRGLVFRGVREPVTVAAHSFREAIMAWILDGLKKPKLDIKKILKMALFHDLCAGYAGDITPYEPFLPKKGEPDKKIFEKWVRLSKKKKEKFYFKKKKIERKALKKLIRGLPANLKREMITLWDEYEAGSSREGRFIQQLDMVENLLQALEYWKEDKKFAIASWWYQMKELVHDPILLRLLEELDIRFHQKKFRRLFKINFRKK